LEFFAGLLHFPPRWSFSCQKTAVLSHEQVINLRRDLEMLTKKEESSRSETTAILAARTSKLDELKASFAVSQNLNPKISLLRTVRMLVIHRCKCLLLHNNCLIFLCFSYPCAVVYRRSFWFASLSMRPSGFSNHHIHPLQVENYRLRQSLRAKEEEQFEMGEKIKIQAGLMEAFEKVKFHSFAYSCFST
jgi:hypothetical protein